MFQVTWSVRIREWLRSRNELWRLNHITRKTGSLARVLILLICHITPVRGASSGSWGLGSSEHPSGFSYNGQPRPWLGQWTTPVHYTSTIVLWQGTLNDLHPFLLLNNEGAFLTRRPVAQSHYAATKCDVLAGHPFKSWPSSTLLNFGTKLGESTTSL